MADDPQAQEELTSTEIEALRDRIKEQTKYDYEKVKILVSFILAIGGGTIVLIFSLIEAKQQDWIFHLKVYLTIIGITCLAILILRCFLYIRDADDRLNQL